jgi:hypothetical protein
MVGNGPAAFISNSTEVTRFMVGGYDEQVLIPAALRVLGILDPGQHRLHRLLEPDHLSDGQIQVVIMVTTVDGPSLDH